MDKRISKKSLLYTSMFSVITFLILSCLIIFFHRFNLAIMLFVEAVFVINVMLLTIFHRKANKKYDEMLLDHCNIIRIKDMVVENAPIGIMFLNNKGLITYANPSVRRILGLVEPAGSNILEFDSVKQTKIYEGVLRAMMGEIVALKSEKYISLNGDIKKYLNIHIHPVINESKKSLDNIMLLIHDYTKEYDLNAKIENTYLSTLKALAALVDAKDAYTGEHSKNVLGYVSMICDSVEYGMNEDKDKIKIAASFHDVGKIGVPDAILNKNGRLSEEEYAVMKTHPVIGADVIKNIEEYCYISTVIRHHHERWDGTGYPDGLKGDEIPFGSQIIAIADTFDAITSDRVYRRARSKEVAIGILLEEKGKQFNPDLVDLFVRVIQRKEPQTSSTEYFSRI